MAWGNDQIRDRVIRTLLRTSLATPRWSGMVGTATSASSAPLAVAWQQQEGRAAGGERRSGERPIDARQNGVPNHVEIMKYVHEGGQDLDPHKLAGPRHSSAPLVKKPAFLSDSSQPGEALSEGNRWQPKLAQLARRRQPLQPSRRALVLRIRRHEAALRGPKSHPVDGEHELFGFLTTEANTTVAPIHPKAMPVILTRPEEVDLWLRGETIEALKLQRPLPDETLRIVARGLKEDKPVEGAPA